MRKTFAFAVAVCILTMSALAWTAAQQYTPAAASTPTIDEALKAVRADLQASRADIVAKNVPLTADQAAKFWPAFAEYQKEQNVIMDEQLKGIQKFVDSYQTLDDAGALGLINAHFDRDNRMNAVRQKWLAEFQKIVPTKLAVRVMQIDRRISLAQQIQIAAHIPLAH